MRREIERVRVLKHGTLSFSYTHKNTKKTGRLELQSFSFSLYFLWCGISMQYFIFHWGVGEGKDVGGRRCVYSLNDPLLSHCGLSYSGDALRYTPTTTSTVTMKTCNNTCGQLGKIIFSITNSDLLALR